MNFNIILNFKLINLKIILISFIFSFSSFIGISEANNNFTNDDLNDKYELDLDYLKIKKGGDYILGPGDNLLISISSEIPELLSNQIIDRSGNINLLKLQKVYVEGLTISELTILLNKAYLEFIKFPDVEIKVLNFRNINVMVKGEVENPGLKNLAGAININNSVDDGSFNQTNNFPQFTGANNIQNFDFNSVNFGRGSLFPTVFDAIRESGGITRFSDLSKVELIRINSISNEGGKIRTILDFSKTLNEGDLNQNIRIYDGDVIIVPKLKSPNNENLKMALGSGLNKKFINVSVSGRVNNPGIITASRVGVLNDAIKLAGGTRVLKGRISFIRLESNGNIISRKIKYSPNSKRGTSNNPYLKEGDIIYVGNNVFTSANEIVSEVTSPLTGLFTFYGLYKAISEDD